MSHCLDTRQGLSPPPMHGSESMAPPGCGLQSEEQPMALLPPGWSAGWTGSANSHRDGPLGCPRGVQGCQNLLWTHSGASVSGLNP